MTNKTCVICGQSKRNNQFTKSMDGSLDSHFGICRSCTGKTDITDRNSVIRVLSMLNLPFVEEKYQQLLDSESPSFGRYTQSISRLKEYETFSDSAFGQVQTAKTNQEKVAQPEQTPEEVSKKMIRRWGPGLEEIDYERLEGAYDLLTTLKTPQNGLEELRYIQNVKLKDALDAAIQEKDKSIPQLRKSYSDDLREIGLDQVLSGGDTDEEPLGMKIKHLEEIGPIETVDPTLEDPDNIMTYVKKWFIIPIKRLFSQATDEEVASLYEDV